MLRIVALNRRSRLTATSGILTSSGHDAKGQPIKNPAEEMNYHHHTSGGPPAAGSHCQGGLWGDCAGLWLTLGAVTGA